MTGEVRYGRAAPPGGGRRPAWLRRPGPVPCSLQTIARVFAHALPPRRSEDRGPLWNPVSRPRLRLEGGVGGGQGDWQGGARGVQPGLLCQGEGLQGKKTRVRAGAWLLHKRAFSLQVREAEYLRGVIRMESPSWAGSLKTKKSSPACGPAFLSDGTSYL